MWETGTIAVNGKKYKFECKHYEQPSADYGIDGGRISKLAIAEVLGETYRYFYNYDRGLDMDIETPEQAEVLERIKAKFN